MLLTYSGHYHADTPKTPPETPTPAVTAEQREQSPSTSKLRKSRYRRPTVHAVRVIEAVELVACHVFNMADRDDRSVSMEMVRTRLDRLREHPAGCCRLCTAARRVAPADVYRIAKQWGVADHRHQAARTALIAIDRRSRAAIALAAYPHPRRPCCDRRSTASTAPPSWAPRSANLGQTAYYSQVIAHFVDRRSRTDRVVRRSSRVPRRRRINPPESSGGAAGCPAPASIAEWLLERNPPCRRVLESMGQPPSIPSFFHPISRRASGLGVAAFPLRCFCIDRPITEAAWAVSDDFGG